MDLGFAVNTARTLNERFAENDEAIKAAGLTGGLKLALERAEIAVSAFNAFYTQLKDSINYPVPTAIIASGGFGSLGLLPLSDVDIRLLLGSGGLPHDEFVVEFKRGMSGNYENTNKKPGFLDIVFRQQDFGSTVLQSIDDLAKDVSGREPDKVISELLDMRVIAGDSSLETIARSQLRALVDRVDYTLKRARYFDRLARRYPHENFDLNGFNIKEGDNGSIRQLQNVVWMDGVKDFENSRVVLHRWDYEDALKSLDVLISARAWLHLNKKRINPRLYEKKESNDVFTPEDIYDFIRRFGADGLNKLGEARENIWRFSKKRLIDILEGGLPVAPGVMYKSDGLCRDSNYAGIDSTDVALTMLFYAGNNGLPIPETERLEFLSYPIFKRPDRKFLDIFSGNWAYNALLDISRASAIGSLLPGFQESFNSYLDEDHPNKGFSRITIALKRIQALEALETNGIESLEEVESFYRGESLLLNPEQRTALKLALFLKGAAASSQNGIHDALYGTLRSSYPEVLDSTLKNAEFLISARKDLIENGAFIDSLIQKYGIEGIVNVRSLMNNNLNDSERKYLRDVAQQASTGNSTTGLITEIDRITHGKGSDFAWKLYSNGNVGDLVEIINYATSRRPEESSIDVILQGDMDSLRSLLLFTWADRSYDRGTTTKERTAWRNRWKELRNTYESLAAETIGIPRHLYRKSYQGENIGAMIRDFKEDFGRRLTEEFPTYLDNFAKVIDNKQPFVAFNPVYTRNKAQLIVASPDFKGLLWRIAGVCYIHDVTIGHTDIYVTEDRKEKSLNLGIDIFELDIRGLKDPQGFIDDMYRTIAEKKDLDIEETPEQIIERYGVAGTLRYVPTTNTYALCAQASPEKIAEDERLAGGLYGLTRYLTENLKANIILAVGSLATSRSVEFSSSLTQEELTQQIRTNNYFRIVDF